MAKKSSRKEQRKELREKREEAQAQKVIKWVFIGLALLAVVGIVWGACI